MNFDIIVCLLVSASNVKYFRSLLNVVVTSFPIQIIAANWSTKIDRPIQSHGFSKN